MGDKTEPRRLAMIRISVDLVVGLGATRPGDEWEVVSTDVPGGARIATTHFDPDRMEWCVYLSHPEFAECAAGAEIPKLRGPVYKTIREGEPRAGHMCPACKGEQPASKEQDTTPGTSVDSTSVLRAPMYKNCDHRGQNYWCDQCKPRPVEPESEQGPSDAHP